MSLQAWTHSTPPFPSTLTLLPITPPKDLTPTQVLVQVVAVALNPIEVQLANSSVFKIPGLRSPKALAADFSGRVLAKGTAVKHVQVGDEVFGMSLQLMGKPHEGALSQVLLLDTTTSPLTLKPTHLTFPLAASLPLVFQTAYTMLSPPYSFFPPSSVTFKPTVVILGGSTSVGIYAIQYASKTLGARVIATCSGKNVEFVKSLGADVVIDYTKEDIPKRLKEERPEEGYTTIVDAVGGKQLFETWEKLLGPRTKEWKEGGNFVTVVGDKTDKSVLGGKTIYLWHPRMVVRHVLGSLGLGPRYDSINLTQDRNILELAAQLVEKGDLRVLLDGEPFTWDDVPKAYERLNSGRATGKVVVMVRDE